MNRFIFDTNVQNIGLVITVVFMLYFRTLFNDPSVDDVNLLKRKPRPFSFYPPKFAAYFYGVGSIINKYLDRLLHMSLFCAICLLINHLWGLAPALLYATNPINNQIAMWQNGRRYSMVILICLLGLTTPWALPLYLYVPYLQVTGLPFVLVLAHKYVWFVPFIALGGWVAWNTSIKSFIRSRLPKIQQKERTVFNKNKLVFAIKSLGFYIVNSIVPTTKLMYYPKFEGFSLTNQYTEQIYSLNRDFWLSIVTLVAVTWVAISTGNLTYWLYYLILIFPWLNWITVTQTLTDRYASISTVFLCVILGNILPLEALMPLLFMYTVATVKQNRMYSSLESFFDFHLYNSKSLDALYFYAVNLILNGHFVDAFVILKNGLVEYPTDYRLNLLMCQVAMKLNPPNARFFLDKARENIYNGESYDKIDKFDLILQEKGF